MPVLDPRRHEQPARPGERLADEVLSGGILAAPGTPVHPVVHALVAVGADVLELVVAPLLGPAAPRAVAHRIHHTTAATPAAAAAGTVTPPGPERPRGVRKGAGEGRREN